MPSFLSKVFGRKKQDDKDSSGHASDPSLLGDKFEKVSPNVSPTAEQFLDSNANKDKADKKSKDKGFTFKSRSSSSTDVSTPKQSAPHLTLNLPGLKDDSSARALGVVFEADPSQLVLSDAVIGSRRLTSLETLVLVRACAQAIMTRGLETPGIMHPHWHSSSPEAQRRLISLFIHSLAPKSPITTLSPTLSAPASAFESEINSTRSPHDISAVLRWGIRHMQLDGASFGTDKDWYKTFFEAEKSAQYPPTAFSDKLAPKIPATHLELLTATLDVFSSLAAHAEANSISGSKLSKLLGLWLLTADRVQSDDDWFSFYARWDRMGRMLEHLFLAHIRNEAANHRMPKRLLELVQHYPYVKGSSPSPDHDLLPRPRFSTQRYDALFVRVDTEYPEQRPSSGSVDLLKLVVGALKAESTGSGTSYELWQKVVKQARAEDESGEQQATSPSTSAAKVPESLSRILADESIRLLTLRANKETVKEFRLDLPPSKSGVNGHTRAYSVDNNKGKESTNGTAHATSSSEGAATSSGSPPISPSTSGGSASNTLGLDWSQFSTSGFIESSSVGSALAATLMDKDVEVTIPKSSSTKEQRSRSIGRRSRQTSPRRTGGRSGELTPLAVSSPTSANADGDKDKAEPKLPTKVVQISLVQLDEAFIDFWSDALLDPISSDWPRFTICRFKNSLLPELEFDNSADAGGVGGTKKRLEWMVIEQVYSKPVPQAASDSTHESSALGAGGTSTASPRGRPISPRPSFASSTTKRVSMWFGGSRTAKGEKEPREKERDTRKEKEKEKKGVRIGEMGEILREEEESPTKEAKKEKEKKRTSWIPRKSADAPKEVPEEKEEKEAKKEEAGVSNADVAAVATGAVALAGGATVLAAASEGKEDKPAEETPVAAVVPEVKEEQPVSTAAPEVSEVETPKAAEPEVAPAEPETKTEKPLEEAPQVLAAAAEPQPEPVVPIVEETLKEEQKEAEEPVLVVEPKEDEAVAVEQAEEPAPVVEEPEVVPPVVEEEEVPIEEPIVESVAEDVPKEDEAVAVEQAEATSALDEIKAEEPAPVVEEVKPSEPAPVVEAEDEPEEAQTSEPVVDIPIVVNDTVIPPEPAAEEPSVAAEPSAPVASFAEDTLVAPPVVEKEDAAEIPNVHVEPLRDPSPAPAEEAEVSLPPVPIVDPIVPLPEPSTTAPPVDLVGETPPPESAPPVEVVDSGLPPAPESVVLSGDTPGPQIALSSSEPAAIALAEKESEPEVPPGLSAEASDVAQENSEPEEESKVDPTPAS